MSETTDKMDQPILSINNFIKAAVLFVAMYAQNQDLKTAIHDEIVERMADQRIMEARIDALEGKTPQRRDQTYLKTADAIVPAQIKFLPYKLNVPRHV